MAIVFMFVWDMFRISQVAIWFCWFVLHTWSSIVCWKVWPSRCVFWPCLNSSDVKSPDLAEKAECFLSLFGFFSYINLKKKEKY